MYFINILFMVIFSICGVWVAPGQASPEKAVAMPVDPERAMLDEGRKGVVIINTSAHIAAYNSGENKWMGTGFIVDKKAGLIVTNRHVAGEMSVTTYTVKFTNGQSVEAKLKYYDPLYDFAFLHVDPKKFPEGTKELEFQDTPVDINDAVFMITNAGGEEFSSYKGTVFSVYENVGPFAEQSFKFSGITIGGASGSPIFSVHQKVVGILYGGQFVTGAALPISYVREALKWLKDDKTPPRKSLGIVPEYIDLDLVMEMKMIPEKEAKTYRDSFPRSNNRVLMINNRIVGSSAREVLKQGDILWTVAGEMIGPRLRRIDELVNERKDDVKIGVYRDGKLVEVNVKPYDLQEANKDEFISFAGGVFYEYNDRTRFATGDAEPGVFISQTSRTSSLNGIAGSKGVFSRHGFAQDDRVKILKVNGKPIKDLKDLAAAIKDVHKSKLFSMTYVDYIGGALFGNLITADRQERFALIKYEPKYDKPTLYKFNPKTLEWDSTLLVKD